MTERAADPTPEALSIADEFARDEEERQDLARALDSFAQAATREAEALREEVGRLRAQLRSEQNSKIQAHVFIEGRGLWSDFVAAPEAPAQPSADDVPLSPVLRDWCEEHNRGSLPDGLCPECEARSATWRLEREAKGRVFDRLHTDPEIMRPADVPECVEPRADDVERVARALGYTCAVDEIEDAELDVLPCAALVTAARAEGRAEMREEALSALAENYKFSDYPDLQNTARSAVARLRDAIRALPTDAPSGQGDAK